MANGYRKLFGKEILSEFSPLPQTNLIKSVHMLSKLIIVIITYVKMDDLVGRPQSNMFKNLPKMFLGISQKFPLLCLDFFLLCLIMLTVIIAVRYVYTHNLYN